MTELRCCSTLLGGLPPPDLEQLTYKVLRCRSTSTVIETLLSTCGSRLAAATPRCALASRTRPQPPSYSDCWIFLFQCSSTRCGSLRSRHQRTSSGCTAAAPFASCHPVCCGTGGACNPVRPCSLNQHSHQHRPDIPENVRRQILMRCLPARYRSPPPGAPQR